MMPLGTTGSVLLYAALAGATGYAAGVLSVRAWTSRVVCEDCEGDGEEGAFSGSHEEPKMVLVVRTDIGMTKGKAAAQCAHAAIACYESLQKTNPALLKRWRRVGQPKITVQTKSQDELQTLQGVAMSLGVTAKSIVDAGRTQLDPGTMTVLGVGPAPRSVVDRITGHLKLY